MAEKKDDNKETVNEEQNIDDASVSDIIKEKLLELVDPKKAAAKKEAKKKAAEEKKKKQERMIEKEQEPEHGQ